MPGNIRMSNNLYRRGGRVIVVAISLFIGFAVSAGAATETVLHTFAGGSEGSDPKVALIYLGGTLYGTTYNGGSFGKGNVFSINPTTGAETVLYSFTGGSDGGCPGADLTTVNGTLYGTTECGGALGDGTVFSITPGGTEKAVYSFCSKTNCSDGIEPTAGLINVNGTIYGTTYSGGTSGHGTVFSINLTSGAETVLYAFTGGSDGDSPMAGLISVRGTLYGTTWLGGTYRHGAVFSIRVTTGTEKVLHSFTGGSDGAYPYSGLVNVKSLLYGTTITGGNPVCGGGCGTVFSINRRTGTQTVLYAFTDSSDGAFPSSGLINVNGALYGTAGQGGTSGAGVVFSINPTTGAETVLHSFAGGTDGSYPYAGLLNARKTRLGTNTLYGTTGTGGSFGCGGAGCGTVFSIAP
jgi:uncharacterized repeat protein (TIGR03803 family)